MWDAPPFDESPEDRSGRIVTGAEADLVKAAIAGIVGSIEGEEEMRELGMFEDKGCQFTTYPFQNMTIEQLWWYCASMTASMLEENVSKVTVNIMSESFIYELIEQIKADLDEAYLWAESMTKLLFDFVGKTYTDVTEEKIEKTTEDCIKALGTWLWLEDDDCLHVEMQNNNMIVSIPTKKQVERSKTYLQKIAAEGYELIKPQNKVVV